MTWSSVINKKPIRVGGWADGHLILKVVIGVIELRKPFETQYEVQIQAARVEWGGPPGPESMPVPGTAERGAVRCPDVVSVCSPRPPGRGRGRDSELRLPGATRTFPEIS